MANKSKGQFIVGGMVFLGALLVIVQAMAWWARREAHWTQKEAKATKAFYLAEAAFDRALWKLKERNANFDDVLNGTAIAGYDNDLEYTDVPGGRYKVAFSAGPGDGELTITATGRDDSSREYRSIQAVLVRRLIVAPLIAPSVTATGAATVHWGSIMSTGNILLQAGPNELYPRKYARGSISASGGYVTRDDNPTAPNTDGLEWWSYDQAPGVPDPIVPNLQYYKAIAQAQGNYHAGMNVTINNLVDAATTTVRYFENNVRFGGNYHFKGVLIVLGNLEFIGAGKAPEGNLVVTPPSDAWLEYQKNSPSAGTGCGGGGGVGAADDGNYANDADAEGDKACADQFPGDAGLHSVEDFTIGVGCAGHGHLGGASVLAAKYQGFVFVRGQLKSLGTTVLHGAIVMDSGASWGGGAFEIFYDPDLRIVAADESAVNFTVSQWREAPAEMF